MSVRLETEITRLTWCHTPTAIIPLRASMVKFSDRIAA